MRANLLDEINKPYVVTALPKGLSERTSSSRMPVRIAQSLHKYGRLGAAAPRRLRRHRLDRAQPAAIWAAAAAR
jgi:hypothetical protein